MRKEINFDMDGTIANFYGVDNWLDYLINSDSTPYRVCEPLVNMERLSAYINALQKRGYKVNIISWLAKNSNADFDKNVTEAKMEWLKINLPNVTFDNISIVSYGTPKSFFGNGFLFDDEKRNRDDWHGIAFSEKEIFEILKLLLDK